MGDMDPLSLDPLGLGLETDVGLDAGLVSADDAEPLAAHSEGSAVRRQVSASRKRSRARSQSGGSSPRDKDDSERNEQRRTRELIDQSRTIKRELLQHSAKELDRLVDQVVAARRRDETAGSRAGSAASAPWKRRRVDAQGVWHGSADSGAGTRIDDPFQSVNKWEHLKKTLSTKRSNSYMRHPGLLDTVTTILWGAIGDFRRRQGIVSDGKEDEGHDESLSPGSFRESRNRAESSGRSSQERQVPRAESSKESASSSSSASPGDSGSQSRKNLKRLVDQIESNMNRKWRGNWQVVSGFGLNMVVERSLALSYEFDDTDFRIFLWAADHRSAERRR